MKCYYKMKTKFVHESSTSEILTLVNSLALTTGVSAAVNWRVINLRSLLLVCTVCVCVYIYIYIFK